MGFGLWAFQNFQISGDRLMLTLCLASFVAAVVLLVYGVWFFRKLKGWSYL